MISTENRRKERPRTRVGMEEEQEVRGEIFDQSSSRIHDVCHRPKVAATSESDNSNMVATISAHQGFAMINIVDELITDPGV